MAKLTHCETERKKDSSGRFGKESIKKNRQQKEAAME